VFWQKRFDDFVARMRAHDLPLRLELWNGSVFDLGTAPRVTITVRSAGALKHFLPPTLDSLGHAYVEGEIDVAGTLPDIIDMATRLAAHHADRGRHGPRMIRHTRKVDAEAIAYHYDVSNDFYARWLDERMVYSCAYFRTPGDTLEAAQTQKIDHILTKLKVRPGDRLLDIGCGWGALVMRAVEKFGARAVGITLSQNQYELARERIERAGLSDRCEVRIEDYRDVAGTFDRISSVGMFEHVGLRNLRGYFTKVRELLADNGAALNHGITSADPDSAESPFGGGDFIDRYVFPHGELPHISLALKEMAAAGLEPVDVENLRRHYALTLNHWAERFEAAGQTLKDIAGEKRWRTWRVYLAGCAHGFDRHWMAIHQILAIKSGASALPMTREYMYDC
jgi:cyclopropane-fatty-acyl-phospholipid synthase